jgi:hypothetical protein
MHEPIGVKKLKLHRIRAAFTGDLDQFQRALGAAVMVDADFSDHHRPAIAKEFGISNLDFSHATLALIFIPFSRSNASAK